MNQKTISLEWWNTRAAKSVVIGIVLVHIVSLGGFSPSAFTWSGLCLCLFLYWLSAGIGITLCYHRLLTHHSFETPAWVRAVLIFCACLAWQGSPLMWVGTHRFHHKHSDTDLDPHTPLHGFSWAHVLWVLTKNPEGFDPRVYVRDLARDPIIRWFDRWWWVVQPLVACIIVLLGWLLGGAALGYSWFVWGVGVRTVLVFHATWFVNSAAHTWGYQNFTTNDRSRNLWWVALLTFGEGWHNNHHHDQCSAAHGMRWFEFDITYWTIRLMALVGLASSVREPREVPQ